MKKTKKLEYKCHSCKKINTREEIGYQQTTEILYDITFNESGEIDEYYEKEQLPEGSGLFYCKHCGEELTEKEETALKIKIW